MNYLLKRVVVHRFIAMLDRKKVSIFIIWVPTCAIRAEPKTPPSAGLAAARVARPNQPGRFWWVNGVSRVEGFHPFPYWSNWISWLNYSILCPPGITHEILQSRIDQIGRHGMDVYINIYIYIALHHVPSLQALDIYPGFNSPNKPWKCWWMVAKNKT